MSHDLKQAAYDLAEEIREGKWNHVVMGKPVPSCPEIINELKQRCPGHPLEEYQRAIADGLFASR